MVKQAIIAEIKHAIRKVESRPWTDYFNDRYYKKTGVKAESAIIGTYQKALDLLENGATVEELRAIVEIAFRGDAAHWTHIHQALSDIKQWIDSYLAEEE